MANWVIVVDDDTASLKTAGHILSKKGLRVSGVTCGHALLDYLSAKGMPDLILLDISMAGMNGFETMKKLRQMEGGKSEVPVIFLSSDENEEAEGRAMRLGAVDYLRKPFEPEDLVRLVKRTIGAQDRTHPAEGDGQNGYLTGNQDNGKAEANTEDRPREAYKSEINLETVTANLADRNLSQNAMWMGQEAFSNIYRYMVRYMERYHGVAYRVLFTVEPAVHEENAAREVLFHFRQLLQRTLRNSDMMMELGDNKLFLLLPEAKDYDIDRVVARLLNQWKFSEYAASARITYEADQAHPADKEKNMHEEDAVYRIAVVDDDELNLKMAERTLSRENMLVTCLKSGQALLEYIKSERPDLILLDILMPQMDGFETMRRLNQLSQPGKEIPVIFLSADENREFEIQALRMGALDIIRKPLIAEVLTLRVRHILALVQLKRNLADEVDRKIKENEALSLRVVQTLAGAIDAKDTYTNGHSARVAQYAREIAKRFGYSKEQQDSIYMSGLLHDVGKIGVSDTIINKPAKLTDTEYAIIKTHPVKGAKILQNIQEHSELAVGARWHHERYDGRGYPDGLSGKDIPEEARIIAVADAYDAMTSRRSYREPLSQDVVRAEIEKGRGTQFDERFASIMLEMIDEDTSYAMREQ